MEELKPCAYCGGELEIRFSSWRDGNPAYVVWHKDIVSAKDCPVVAAYYTTKEDAIKAFNNRHVETCKNLGEYNEVDQFICSECGIWLEDWVEVEFNEEESDDVAYEYELAYCPNCGRKIV